MKEERRPRPGPARQLAALRRGMGGGGVRGGSCAYPGAAKPCSALLIRSVSSSSLHRVFVLRQTRLYVMAQHGHVGGVCANASNSFHVLNWSFNKPCSQPSKRLRNGGQGNRHTSVDTPPGRRASMQVAYPRLSGLSHSRVAPRASSRRVDCEWRGMTGSDGRRQVARSPMRS